MKVKYVNPRGRGLALTLSLTAAEHEYVSEVMRHLVKNNFKDETYAPDAHGYFHTVIAGIPLFRRMRRITSIYRAHDDGSGIMSINVALPHDDVVYLLREICGKPQTEFEMHAKADFEQLVMDHPEIRKMS